MKDWKSSWPRRMQRCVEVTTSTGLYCLRKKYNSNRPSLLKRSFANKVGTVVGLASLGVNMFQIAVMLFIVNSISYVSLVASAIACFVALVVIKRMIIDMAPTHSKCRAMASARALYTDNITIFILMFTNNSPRHTPYHSPPIHSQ